MKVINTTVYDFNELDEKAKEHARRWWRAAGVEDDWYQPVYEDAANVGLKLTNFGCDSASFIRNLEGELIASAEDTAAKIIADHGKECSTYRTAENYQAAFKAMEEPPEYPTEGNKEMDVWISAKNKLDEDFLDALLRNYTHTLQKELEYKDSDEYVDEAIELNGYTFTESGKRFG